MEQLEAIYEALRKVREWAAQGKINTARAKRLQTVLERRLEAIDYRKSA